MIYLPIKTLLMFLNEKKNAVNVDIALCNFTDFLRVLS